MSESPARGMLAGAPRHLCPQDAGGHPDSALVLPESHTTFSLLPDCLAARLPGTLSELEEIVAEAEQGPSLMAVADRLRCDAVELPGAMRWVRRRVRLVHHALRLVIGLCRCSCPAATLRSPTAAGI